MIFHLSLGTCEIGPKGHETIETIATIYGYDPNVVVDSSSRFHSSNDDADSSALNTSAEVDTSGMNEQHEPATKHQPQTSRFFSRKKSGDSPEIPVKMCKNTKSVGQKRQWNKVDCSSDDCGASHGHRRESYFHGLMPSENCSSDGVSECDNISSTDRASSDPLCQNFFSQIHEAIHTSLQDIVSR
jgi:hypothetical protein